MPQENELPKQTYEAVCIAPNGVGYGEGSISATKRETATEFPISSEELRRAQEILIAHRDEIVIPVEEEDDGCGDGRSTLRIFRVIDGQTGEVHMYNKSRKRAKIFGGGLQVAASMWRAVSGEPKRGETVLGDRTFIASELKQRGVAYGAHTDTHAHGDNCGCGAIDKYAVSTELSATYRQDIVATLPVFYGDSIDQADTAINQAFSIRSTIAGSDYMSNASGRKTMDFIERDGAVVKQLDDDHFEAIDFFNEEPGTTIDQEKIAELFAEAGLPKNIQVFAVDVWRGRMYADVVADIAVGYGFEYEAARAIALADFFINQLSVSATLTDGTQPVIYNRVVTA